jgi:hypothetical protein
MTTEYEASVRLVFWGDLLKPEEMLRELKLTPAFCETKIKGDALTRPDGTSTGSAAKTGRLIYFCVEELPDERHNPETQLAKIAELLSPLPDRFFQSHGVEDAQIQMFFYYEKKAPGEPDFLMPPALVLQAARHAIRLSMSIMP